MQHMNTANLVDVDLPAVGESGAEPKNLVDVSDAMFFSLFGGGRGRRSPTHGGGVLVFTVIHKALQN